MIIAPLARSIAQLSDPKIIGLVFKSGLLSLLVFVAVLVAAWLLIPLIPPTGISWIDWFLDPLLAASAPVAVLFGAYFFFPAVVTIFIGMFLDDVTDAVERKYYPERLATRSAGIGEGLFMGLRLFVYMALLNILVLPVYIALLVTGVGSLLLYLVLNGYLLGREYFEMVAIRHAGRREADKLRGRHRWVAFVGGLVVAGLFLVPFVNLLAPIIGVALFTHLIQRRVLPKADPQG